jgi:origin recognition complex subunit 1
VRNPRKRTAAHDEQQLTPLLPGSCVKPPTAKTRRTASPSPASWGTPAQGCEDKEDTRDAASVIVEAEVAAASVPAAAAAAECADGAAEKAELCKECNSAGELVLCDGCDSGFHLKCCKPALRRVPKGDWFCGAACKEKKEGKQCDRWRP